MHLTGIQKEATVDSMIQEQTRQTPAPEKVREALHSATREITLGNLTLMSQIDSALLRMDLLARR